MYVSYVAYQQKCMMYVSYAFSAVMQLTISDLS
jgi:hypothetical protein